jgi:hypothetical protein
VNFFAPISLQESTNFGNIQLIEHRENVKKQFWKLRPLARIPFVALNHNRSCVSSVQILKANNKTLRSQVRNDSIVIVINDVPRRDRVKKRAPLADAAPSSVAFRSTESNRDSKSSPNNIYEI